MPYTRHYSVYKKVLFPTIAAYSHSATIFAALLIICLFPVSCSQPQENNHYNSTNADNAETKSQTTSTGEPQIDASASKNELTRKPFIQSVPGTTATFKMVPIPAGTIEFEGTQTIPAMWVCENEMIWDIYDIWVYSIDEPDTNNTALTDTDNNSAAHSSTNSNENPDNTDTDTDNDADIISRPSKPYLPPDRGFGYNNYAAISLTYKSADEFCKWLTAKTGRFYRLPTEAEWEYIVAAGSTGTKYHFGDDETKLTDYAWYIDNSESKTHPVRKKKPNKWGIYDGHGNVAEWCLGMNGQPTACGGSYKDNPAGLRLDARQTQTYEWNESDPQFPKSQWWLADCSFVGFRVVCIPEF